MKLYKQTAVCGLLLVMAILPSCSKSSGNDNDTQQPVITLTSPSNNQVYTNGDNVVIQGTVTDNALHEVRIRISNGSTSLFTKIIPAHEMTNVTINESWKSTITTSITPVVVVEAEDLGGHIVDKTVNIIINL